ncbi:hypothetical protein Tco_0771655 [Tanacetum coccineum]|uniref:Uncharacterized protein n=1 Tax=Tanacetum coccineum TaxID=301880 RepID=A0ABQ4ZFQ5_9ASTR
MGKGKDIIVLSSDSEDINEGLSKGNVPKEDINEGPSKGKLVPLGSSTRPRPEVGPELTKLFKYGPPPDLLRWYGYADVDEYLEDPFFDSPKKETKDKSSMDTFSGKEKAALRDEVSAARQEGLPPGWELDMIAARQKFGLEYLKNLEECMDDGDSRVAKEMKLFDALEHKSIVIEVGNQKFAIFTKVPLRTFGEPLMRYSVLCKVDGQGARDTKLDLVDLGNYVTEKVLDSIGFVHVSISDYSRKMVNDVNVEIHRVKFKADFVVLDYANKGEPSIMFGREFLATTKSQVDFGLGEIKMNLTMFEEFNSVVDLLEDIRSSSEEVVKMGKANRNKGEKMKEVLDIRYKELEESKHILEVLENYINGVVGMVALVDTRASLPLLLGRPFLRTCGAIIDMGRGTLCIDDEVIRHTYFPKPRSKSYVETFEMEGEDDWLADFNAEGNKGYGTYKKIDGNGNWHARFEIVTPSGRKFNRAFKTKTTTRKLSGKFITEDKSRKDTLPNPLIVDYEKRNKKNIITYSLQPVSNGNLKWKDLPSVERHTYCERLSKLQDRKYIYEGDGDVFVDYSWERALSIDDEIYPEWVLEFFSTINEHILTLPEFAVMLGLFTEDEVNYQLFGIHVGKLEVDDRQFDHREYWTKVGKPTLTNHKEVLVKEPLMRICGLCTKRIMRSLVHRTYIVDTRFKKARFMDEDRFENSHVSNLELWIYCDHCKSMLWERRV